MSTQSPRKFALHRGSVISQNDGDHHRIAAATLIRLYELNPGEYIIWPEDAHGMNWKDYRHLYPRSDGRYDRPRDE